MPGWPFNSTNLFRNVENHYFSHSGSDKQCFNKEFASKSGSAVVGTDLPTAYGPDSPTSFDQRTRSSEMNITLVINNSLRAIDPFRSVSI